MNRFSFITCVVIIGVLVVLTISCSSETKKGQPHAEYEKCFVGMKKYENEIVVKLTKKLYICIISQ